MPAIDLPKVRARAAALAEQLSDMPALLANVHALLEDYADPARHLNRKPVEGAAPNVFGTPMPVVRTVVTALRKPAQASPPAALEALKGLWAAGSREERRIAAELAGVLAQLIPAEVQALIDRWLLEVESAETADALAEYAFGPLMLADPITHLQSVYHWVTHPQKWVRRFGLSTLGPLTKDRKWDDVQRALEVIRNVMAEADPDVRKAVAVVVRDLIPKGPAEVNRFLHEQALRPNNNTHWIIRTAMVKLSAEEQAEIVSLMRA